MFTRFILAAAAGRFGVNHIFYLAEVDHAAIAQRQPSGAITILNGFNRAADFGIGQHRGAEPQTSPFFGRQAYTMTLAARLSETGATVLFTWGERLSGGAGYRIHFSAPTVPLEGDLEARAVAINREVEALIRACPGQYLWGYNRYKRPKGVDAPPPAAGAGNVPGTA